MMNVTLLVFCTYIELETKITHDSRESRKLPRVISEQEVVMEMSILTSQQCLQLSNIHSHTSAVYLSYFYYPACVIIVR